MNLKTTLKIFAIGILVVLIALLSVDIFNGSFSFEEKNKLDNLVDAKEIELTQIYNENQNLKDEIETIKDDDEYVEHIARENFGLIMDFLIILKIMDTLFILCIFLIFHILVHSSRKFLLKIINLC